LAAGLVPVLKFVGADRGLSACARRLGQALPAALQIDSGMGRLGLMLREMAHYLADRERYAGIDLRFIMSHLACADEPAKAASAYQCEMFERLTADFPGAPRSLANSSGIFLGADYHYDLVRPGAALYGINPTPASANPMRPVVRMTTQVIQIRDIAAGDHVGYGWDFRATGWMRLATLSIGYADGLHRALAPRGGVMLQGHRLPIVGRVSMDSLIVDVTALRDGVIAPGTAVEIIGDHQTVDDLATAMTTIGYEVLTSACRKSRLMKVLVLGAGVIGVTTAYYLSKRGFEVTVIDRQSNPGLETSFANAGEVSPGYASPWAGPGVPVKAIRWMLDRHGPLVVRPQANPAIWRWISQMLRNCTAARYAVNKARMVGIAEYSRDCLRALRAETDIHYDERSQGTLQLFRKQAQLDDIGGDVEILRQYNVPYEVLDREGCIGMGR
jgi:alanine racemase